MSEGDVDQTSKDNNIIDLWKFRYLLSNQMIKYNPKYWKYAGGAKIRPATQHNQATTEKGKDDASVKIGRPSEKEVQLSNLAKNIYEYKYRQGANWCLCSNLKILDMHLNYA